MAEEQTPTRTLDPAQLDFGPIEMGETELADGAILILRTQMDSNSTRLVVRKTDDMDWIVLRGMMEAALQFVIEDQSSLTITAGEDDDEGD